MTHHEILSHRLLNQQLLQSKFTRPEEVVHWMIAMQAQEYAMAKWAIGLRVPGFCDKDIEQLFNEGKILRTHLMRPTWHFVSPLDIRWLLALTAPRIYAINVYYYKKEGLDSAIFNRCNDVMTRCLEGNKFLTRNAISAELEKAGITASGLRLTCIMMNAELEGIICSGPREGRQFTYALLEERVQNVQEISQEEALQQFMNRFFASRGPATLQDFCYWSGLSITDARAGANGLSKDFEKRHIDKLEYIFLPQDISVVPKVLPTFLMPDYDEYGMSYKNRDALIFENAETRKINMETTNHMLIVEGKLGGTWQKFTKGKSFEIETYPTINLLKKQETALAKAVEHYRRFSKGTTE